MKKAVTIIVAPFVIAWLILCSTCEMISEMFGNLYYTVYEILWKDKEQDKLKNPHV